MRFSLATTYLLGFLSLAALCHAETALSDAEALEKTVKPFLAEHCYKCHGPDKRKGDLRLDTLETDFRDSQTAGHWVEVMDNINLGEMPPDDEPLPEAHQLDLVARWIAGELEHARRLAQSTDGRVMLRRLNRSEYTHTVQDLLAVKFLPNEGPSDLLPPDGTLDGFDKASKALLMDPSLLETYFTVAAAVVDKAVVEGEPPVPTWRSRMEYEDIDGGIAYIKDARSVEVREDGLISMDHGMRSQQDLLHPYSNTLIPIRGKYIVRIRMGADPGNSEEPVYVRVNRKGDGELFYTEVDAPINKPKVYEFTHAFEPDGGDELGIELVNMTGFGIVDYYGLDYRKNSEELAAQGNNKDAGRIRAQAAAEGHFSSRHNPETLSKEGLPRVFFDWIEIEGPIYEAWPPRSAQLLFPEGLEASPQDLAYAREVIARLLPRAYRRPVADSEINVILGIVANELKAGADFTSAMKSGIVGILCSPSFLYLFEPSVNERPRRLNNFEIATRLSYFLWSSMPDDMLFQLATRQQLDDPRVLRDQVNRMLADHRSEALVTGFASQWLKADEFDRFSPDKRLYRDYYSAQFSGVNEDINEEPLAVFREILTHDLSTLNFLDADWTMANERLSNYYGIGGVEGEEFRRVKLHASSPRGGLISMAAVHKWGSDGNRTKPVERGKYILEVLFNDPPNPPPPNVGEVEPNVQGENLTVRERLDQHRTIESCANCHRTIDPYGLALENFNVVGKWRTKQDGERGHWPERAVIDPSGTLPNGESFADFEEFKRALSKQEQRFLRGLSEKMFSYALGRTVEPTDRGSIDSLVTEMNANGNTLRSLIHGIVQSEEFAEK